MHERAKNRMIVTTFAATWHCQARSSRSTHAQAAKRQAVLQPRRAATLANNLFQEFQATPIDQMLQLVSKLSLFGAPSACSRAKKAISGRPVGHGLRGRQAISCGTEEPKVLLPPRSSASASPTRASIAAN